MRSHSPRRSAIHCGPPPRRSPIPSSGPSFYGWLPLYLPELFPTRIRATAQGFAFNFGRVLAAMQNQVQNGVLIAADFPSSFAPPAVRKMLNETETLHNACATNK